MEITPFIGEKVDEGVEEGGEAAAEHGGNAEESQHEQQGGHDEP